MNNLEVIKNLEEQVGRMILDELHNNHSDLEKQYLACALTDNSHSLEAIEEVIDESQRH